MDLPSELNTAQIAMNFPKRKGQGSTEGNSNLQHSNHRNLSNNSSSNMSKKSIRKPSSWSSNFSQKLTWLTAFTVVILFVLANVDPVYSCNEAVCASIVSKCTLLKSCECEIIPGEPCECCDRCKKCLDYLLTECCSCFELCPKPNVSELRRESVVHDITEPIPTLWDALTQEADDRWEKFTYPVDIPPSMVVRPKKSESEATGGGVAQYASIQDTIVVEKADLATVNCTVVFLNQCTAKEKCKISCSTMGATASRWFEDGCCECVGHHCPAYGINESRCSSCGFDEDDDDFESMSDAELAQKEAEYDADYEDEDDDEDEDQLDADYEEKLRKKKRRNKENQKRKPKKQNLED